MIQKSILIYLSKLEGFKTAIKNCHWAAKSMNAHEFMDSLEDIVSDNQDLFAEITQGAYNTKIKVNDFKPKPYRISTFTKLVTDIYNAADKFYSTIQGNKRFIGLRSVMEDFMGKMQQQAYLNAMCTEGTMRVMNVLKENCKTDKMRLTEDVFIDLVNETVMRVINESFWVNDVTDPKLKRERDELEEKYQEFLLKARQKENVYPSNFKEFVKEYGSPELYRALYFNYNFLDKEN